jgi:hypothetical protein
LILQQKSAGGAYQHPCVTRLYMFLTPRCHTPTAATTTTTTATATRTVAKEKSHYVMKMRMLMSGSYDRRGLIPQTTVALILLL